MSTVCPRAARARHIVSWVRSDPPREPRWLATVRMRIGRVWHSDRPDGSCPARSRRPAVPPDLRSGAARPTTRSGGPGRSPGGRPTVHGPGVGIVDLHSVPATAAGDGRGRMAGSGTGPIGVPPLHLRIQRVARQRVRGRRPIRSKRARSGYSWSTAATTRPQRSGCARYCSR